MTTTDTFKPAPAELVSYTLSKLRDIEHHRNPMSSADRAYSSFNNSTNNLRSVIRTRIDGHAVRTPPGEIQTWIKSVMSQLQGFERMLVQGMTFETAFNVAQPESVITEQFVRSQLEALNTLVGTDKDYTSLEFEGDYFRMVSKSITLYNDDDVPVVMGRYNVRVNLRELSNSPVNSSIEEVLRVTGGTESGDYIHPHIGNGSACYGSAHDPILRLLGAGAFVEAMQTFMKFLTTYNSGSPLTELENWIDGADRCITCNEWIDAGDENVVSVNGDRYHAGCTTEGRFFDDSIAIVPRHEVRDCDLCGRTVSRRHVNSSREGCTQRCLSDFAAEVEAGRRGFHKCHNCHTEVPTDAVIITSRGDKLCKHCTTPAPESGAFVIAMSTRWNASQVVGKRFVTGVGDLRSVLRNESTVNRRGVNIVTPKFETCSCGATALNTEIMPCRLMAGQTSCPSCDPEKSGVSRRVKETPEAMYMIISTWVESSLLEQARQFVDVKPVYIIPMNNLIDVTKRVMQVMSAGPTNQPGMSLRDMISSINTVVGVDLVEVTDDAAGAYDAIYAVSRR